MYTAFIPNQLSVVDGDGKTKGKETESKPIGAFPIVLSKSMLSPLLMCSQGACVCRGLVWWDKPEHAPDP